MNKYDFHQISLENVTFSNISSLSKGKCNKQDKSVFYIYFFS